MEGLGIVVMNRKSRRNNQDTTSQPDALVLRNDEDNEAEPPIETLRGISNQEGIFAVFVQHL